LDFGVFALAKVGGRERIRTSDRLSPTPDFESGAFNHSATLPAMKPLAFFGWAGLDFRLTKNHAKKQ
jgi:hypothetical protein